MRRAMREEVAKSAREEFCATLKHRPEAMRKDHEWLTREALDSMRYRYEADISALREGHSTEMQRLREGMGRRNRRRKRRRRRQI